jgi:hypothetical protein
MQYPYGEVDIEVGRKQVFWIDRPFMVCASNMNFTIVIPFVVAVRIKGPTLSFPRHTILASFRDTLVSPGSGCN